jgi:hypothetical protein
LGDRRTERRRRQTWIAENDAHRELPRTTLIGRMRKLGITLEALRQDADRADSRAPLRRAVLAEIGDAEDNLVSVAGA